jgi:tetratricopeptide (TPR) repeat protein
MAADSRSSRWRICREGSKCSRYSKKANQLSWLVVDRNISAASLVLCLLLVLTSLTAVGQAPDPNRRALIHGLIVSTQGRPVARATVEVRDLHGVKMATVFTDAAGSFAITAAAEPGEYVLLAAKEWQIEDELITLDRADREMTIALPFIAAATVPQVYTVSTQALRVPARALAYLESAREKFRKSNFAGAHSEIDHALQVDATCAAAFSMRALLRLSSKDFSGAIEDATLSLALDPAEGDAYLSLATAYNSVSEFQKAETAAQQALAMRPDLWQGRLEMAKAFYGQGRLVLALRELDELSKDFPDVHLVRANVLLGLTRSDEAAQEFGLFLKEAPEDRRSEQVRRIVASTVSPSSSLHP